MLGWSSPADVEAAFVAAIARVPASVRDVNRSSGQARMSDPPHTEAQAGLRSSTQNGAQTLKVDKDIGVRLVSGDWCLRSRTLKRRADLMNVTHDSIHLAID
jgi:hypothetical protein